MNPTQKLIEAALELVHVIDTTKPCHRHVEEAADDVREAVRGLREAGEPAAGWKLVPVEPTAAMLASALAAAEKHLLSGEGFATADESAAGINSAVYRAMLYAAPPSPAPQPDDHNQLAEVVQVFYQGELTVTADGKFWTTRLVPSQPAQDGGEVVRWRAMDAAPKDGGPILLRVPTRSAKHSRHIQAQGAWLGERWCIFNADEAVQAVEPDGWLPLVGHAVYTPPAATDAQKP